jgi:hypothetical protein
MLSSKMFQKNAIPCFFFLPVSLLNARIARPIV